MHTVSGTGDCDVSAGVDQDSSCGSATLRGTAVSNGAYDRVSQSLKFTAGKIFFAELNKVDAAACGLSDFVEKSGFASGIVASKLFSVSDVVKEQTSF